MRLPRSLRDMVGVDLSGASIEIVTEVHFVAEHGWKGATAGYFADMKEAQRYIAGHEKSSHLTTQEHITLVSENTCFILEGNVSEQFLARSVEELNAEKERKEQEFKEMLDDPAKRNQMFMDIEANL